MNTATVNIFEEASKQKLRFSTDKGELTTEQLWDLPLQSTKTHQLDLDTVAKAINNGIRRQDEDSFVQRRTNPVKAQLVLKLEILKAIIARKQADEAAARAKAVTATRRAQLLDALENQKQKTLEGMDEAAIRAELAALDDQ